MSKAATTEMKGSGQVMTVDLNKHNQGLRLALWKDMKKKKLDKAQNSELKLTSSQYYGVGANMAVGAFGIYSYYIY